VDGKPRCHVHAFTKEVLLMETLKRFRHHLLWTAILVLLLIVISSSLVTVSASPNSSPRSADQATYEENASGFYTISNEASFLYLTGSLPGTWSNAEWQWRNGIGAAKRWWVNVDTGNLYLFPKSRNTWHPDQETSASNYLALSIPLNLFQGWFWCGIPLYNNYHQFQGYGCDPRYGPQPSAEGELAPWVETANTASQAYVWQVLGAYCVINRTEHIQIEPACPEEGQNINLTISGNWGDSCPLINHSMVYNDNRFEIGGRIHSSEDPETVCPSVVTDWTFTEELGALEAGTYKIVVSMMDTDTGFWSFQDGMTFEVTASPNPPE
jgi:hypothetical protein